MVMVKKIWITFKNSSIGQLYTLKTNREYTFFSIIYRLFIKIIHLVTSEEISINNKKFM